MSYTTALNLSTKSPSTKDQIINILSNQWPLSAKEIYNKTAKEFGNEASYQAIHKTLTELEKNHTISHNGQGYELDKLWISNSKKFFDELESRYYNTPEKYKIDKNFEGRIKFEFNDFSQFCVTMAQIFSSGVLAGNSPNVGFGLLRHAWWPFNFSFANFELLKEIGKTNKDAYVIVKENYPFDMWIVNQYKKVGWHSIITDNKDAEYENDIGVQGDSIWQAKFSEETKKLMDTVYKRNADLGDLFQEYVRQSLKKYPVHIEVTIEKNPTAAKLLLIGTVKKYFGVYIND